MANKRRRSMHRRCLRAFYHYVSNNPPSAPCLRVTLLQTLNTSGKTYHSKFRKNLILFCIYAKYCIDIVFILNPFGTYCFNLLAELI